MKKKFRNQAAIDCYEEGDIIVPNSLFGELLYIYYILKDIYSSNKNRDLELKKLKVQIKIFFICWKSFIRQ